ncbi:hypothetical protein D1F64_04730 [Breoghania sp. L-A4]|nr:hypothetical protein D1F64_04730 [Breoghania sp. L-A4]
MSDRFFSFVLLPQHQRIDAEAIVARVKELAGPIGMSASVLRGEVGDQPAIVEFGGVKISIIAKAEPVPGGTLDRPATTSIGWPGAPEAVAGHSAHVIVGCLDLPRDHEQALHFAVATTLVTAACLQTAGGLGVYWATGQLMISPESYRNAAETITNKNLPVEDWVNLFWIKGKGKV